MKCNEKTKREKVVMSLDFGQAISCHRLLVNTVKSAKLAEKIKDIDTVIFLIVGQEEQ